MLSFARDPQGFINDWLQSQCRDLKVSQSVTAGSDLEPAISPGAMLLLRQNNKDVNELCIPSCFVGFEIVSSLKDNI